MEKYLNIRNQNIPVLGFGTWNITGNSCVESVEDALSMGYRHIDTARAYGNEKEVGRAMKNSSVRREDIYLVTKIATSELVPEKIIKVTDDSLKNLQTDYIDLLLIHWPVPGMDLKGILSEMMKLVKEGKTRTIGVSNFSPDLVQQALSIAPEIICNQVEFNPYHLQHENLHTAKENDMFITAYTPVAKGKVNKDDKIVKIAEKHGKTPAQVTLRWLAQHKNVSVIPKAASKKHREENMDIFDFELDENEMKEIASAR
ncbi:MAG: aldo/keto reductase [Bacteroidota bacterium]